MYTMMQACKETNMSYQALKYYCNEGLVPNVKRDSNNRRVFDEHDVKWIKDLVCLKRCGMSILEMKEYLELCLPLHHPAAQTDACQKAAGAARFHPGAAGKRRLHRLETELL